MQSGTGNGSLSRWFVLCFFQFEKIKWRLAERMDGSKELPVKPLQPLLSACRGALAHCNMYTHTGR